MHEFESGFTVRTPAWHAAETGCAVLADHPGSLAEARTLAGMDWEPHVVPSYRAVEVTLDPAEFSRKELKAIRRANGEIPTTRTEYHLVPGSAFVERTDTNAVIGQNITETWTPITNTTLWEIVEALCSSGAKIDAAGVLRTGSVVWALVLLDEPYRTAGDSSETLPYVGVVNSHDGSMMCRAMSTQVRIVCMNTVQAGWLDSANRGTYFEFRHTAKVMERIEEAKEAIAGARQDSIEWRMLARRLHEVKVTPVQLGAFIAEFIPEPIGNIISDRVRDNIGKARAQFAELYNGETNETTHGTALGLVNASVEYLDHVRGFRNTDTLLGRQILRPEPLKARAFRLALEVCA